MLASGTRLGPYEILAPLGAGGMGEVYRARDSRLGRDVAIKTLSAGMSGDPSFLRRFEHEARAASALNHPGIVTIHDVGRVEDVSFLAMEWIDGTSLREILDGRPLPIRRLLGIAAPIADGLAAAHAAGIVHRDLKPENIMIDRAGRAKILDFGLAKSVPLLNAREKDPTITLAEPTREGTILGTFGYMAPEQASGRAADFRSDQFSFGAVLYEMATGIRAFRGDSPAETISAVLREDPRPIREIAPGTPAPLCWIVDRCLAKNPEERYGSTLDLARDLENLRSDGGSGASTGVAPPPRGPRRGWPAALALLATMAVAGAALLFFSRRPSRPAATVRFAVAAPAGAGLEGMPAVSPTGDRIAFVASGNDGRKHLWIRRLDALSPEMLPGGDDAWFPFWSPDGRSLAFFAEERLKRIAIDGGAARTLCRARDPRGGTWGSRGEILFSVDGGSRIDGVSEAGGTARRVTTLDARRGDGTHRFPFFLPDGERFLFYVLTPRAETTGVYAGSVSSPSTRLVVPADSGGYPSGGTIFFRRRDALLSQPFDSARAAVSGQPRIVSEEVWSNPWAPGWTGLSVASDAPVMAFQGGGVLRTRLVWFDRSGRELSTVGTPDAYGEIALSPDEKHALVVVAPGLTGGDIWEFDLARGASTKVTGGGTFDDCPVYLAAGDEIAYSTYPDNKIVRQARSDGAPRRLVYQSPGFPALQEWSPFLNAFLFTQIDLSTARMTLWSVDAEARARRLDDSTANEDGPTLSPDHRTLAFTSDETGRTEVYVRRFDGSAPKRRISTAGGAQPSWSGDGAELFYVENDARLMAVAVSANDPGAADAPRLLFAAPLAVRIEARNHYVAARDGRRFLLNVRQPQTLPMTVLVNGFEDKARP